MNRKLLSLFASLPALLLAACASGPTVQPQMAKAQEAIRGAEEVGAQKLPAASLHLKLAKENSQLGERLAKEDEPVAAQRALERAELDAELAIALIKEHNAQREMNNVQGQLDELGSDLKQ